MSVRLVSYRLVQAYYLLYMLIFHYTIQRVGPLNEINMSQHSILIVVLN